MAIVFTATAAAIALTARTAADGRALECALCILLALAGLITLVAAP